MPAQFTETDARRLLLETAPSDWARGTEAVFVMADRGDACAGLIDLRVGPQDAEVGEVGFVVLPQARGRGYAPAALRALCRWGFAELGLVRIQWRAEVGNESSRRAADKAGFTMEGRLRSAYLQDGRRRDCWIGSMVPGGVTG